MDQAASPTRTWASSTPLPAGRRNRQLHRPRRGQRPVAQRLDGGRGAMEPQWLGRLLTFQALAPVNTNWQIAGTGDFTGAGEDGVLWRNASTGGVELWNSNGSGGFACQGLGASVNTNWAGRGNRRFHRQRRGRHPVAKRLDRGRRALEPEWRGRLHLRSPEPGQHQLAGRGNRRFHRQRRGQHPLAQFLDRTLSSCGIRTARAASPTRTWAPSAPAGRFSNRASDAGLRSRFSLEAYQPESLGARP